MTGKNPEFKKLEKRLEGESIVVGEYTVKPVAQVTGRHVIARGETGKGVGGGLRITPLEVIVGKGEDEPYPISLTNEKETVLKGFVIAGLLIAALCWFVIIAVNVFKLFKENKQ
jgi:hypothetical protein